MADTQNRGHFIDNRPLSFAENPILAQNEQDVQAVHRQVKRTNEWFRQASDTVKREVVLQLVLCVNNTSIMKTVRDLLRPLSGKDRAYSRARPRSGLEGDNAKANTNHMLLETDIEDAFSSLYTWFRLADGRSQKLFLINFLQHCEPHILQVVANVAGGASINEEGEMTQSSASMASRRMKSAVSFHESVQNPQVNDAANRVQSAVSRRSFAVSSGYRAQSNINRRQSNDKQRDEISEAGLGIQDLSGDEDEFPEYSRARLRTTKPSASISMSAGSSASQRRAGSAFVMTEAHVYVGQSQYKDFIRYLPIHLAKRIISYLSLFEIHRSRLVCKFWKLVADQAISEYFVQQDLAQEVMLIRGTTAEQVNPNYANDTDVPVPNLVPDSNEVASHISGDSSSRSDDSRSTKTGKTSTSTSKSRSKNGDKDLNFSHPSVLYRLAYQGLSTRNVIMEERNIFCGSFNTIVISQQDTNPTRLINTTDGMLVAEVFDDMRLRLFDCERCEKVRLGPKLRSYLHGHVGPIHCVLLLEQENMLISGSYDTTVRKWDLEKGKCVKIFQGHLDTINAVSVNGDLLASASRDRTCKIWQLHTRNKKPLHSLEHRRPLTAVALDIKICVTGDDRGRLKVWDMRLLKPIKMMNAHQRSVTVIKLDRWHIISAGVDGYVKVWSAIGDCNRNLLALRHPKAVRSMQFMYLRIVTGCDDGRVRIWNMLTGQCCRVLRGNSRSEPVLGMFATEKLDKIIVSTKSNILAFAFRQVNWDYDAQNEQSASDTASILTSTTDSKNEAADRPAPRKVAYSYIRAQRMAITGCSDPRIVQNLLNTVEEVPASDDESGYDGEPARSTSTASRLSRSALSHSAFTLSPTSVGQARSLQGAAIALARATSTEWPPTHRHDLFFTTRARVQSAPPALKTQITGAMAPSDRHLRFAEQSAKKGGYSAGMQTAAGGAQAIESVVSKSRRASDKPQRRFSFSFEKPVPTIEELERDSDEESKKNRNGVTLQEVKQSLRRRIRHPEDYHSPEFVDATVNMIQRKQAARKTNLTEFEAGFVNRDSRKVMLEDASVTQFLKPPSVDQTDPTSFSRPSSSPGWYDVASRMDADTIKREKQNIMSVPSPATLQHFNAQQLQLLQSAAQYELADMRRRIGELNPTVSVVRTAFAPQRYEIKSSASMFDESVPTSIPKAREVRPISASPVYQGRQIRRATLREALVSNVANEGVQQVAASPSKAPLYGAANHGMTPEERRRQLRGLTTRSKGDVLVVPIKMYPPGFLENLKTSLRQKVIENRNQRDRIAAISSGIGAASNLSPFERVDLQLQTHAEAEKKAEKVRQIYEKHRADEKEQDIRMRKERWLRAATAPVAKPAYGK